jgi:hypothetical protein
MTASSMQAFPNQAVKEWLTPALELPVKAEEMHHR